MMKFEYPEVELVKYAVMDVIATSIDEATTEEEEEIPPGMNCF